MYSSIVKAEGGMEVSAPVSMQSRRRDIAFGRFVALPSARALILDGVPVSIGARAFDLLMVLLASRGEIVDKGEIVRQVWPTTTVDESNLRFQMAELRKALGSDRHLIKTIPGRGYLLAWEVEVQAVNQAALSAASERTFPELLPHQRAFGEALCALLQAFHRHPDAIEPVEALLAMVVARDAVDVRSAA